MEFVSDGRCYWPIRHDPGASVPPGTSRTGEQSHPLPRAQESARRVWSRDTSSGLQRSQWKEERRKAGNRKTQVSWGPGKACVSLSLLRPRNQGGRTKCEQQQEVTNAYPRVAGACLTADIPGDQLRPRSRVPCDYRGGCLQSQPGSVT